MLTTVVGILATCAGVSRAWPQFARIVLRREAEGVSAATWMLSLAAFLTWIGIGISQHIVPTIVVNVLCVTSAVAVLAALVTVKQAKLLRVVAVFIGVPVMDALIHAAFGAVGLSVAGVSLSVGMFVPQAIKVLRRPTTGISLPTWYLAILTSVLWMTYGVLTGKYVVAVPNLVMTPAALIIVVKTLSDRRLINESSTQQNKSAATAG